MILLVDIQNLCPIKMDTDTRQTDRRKRETTFFVLLEVMTRRENMKASPSRPIAIYYEEPQLRSRPDIH